MIAETRRRELGDEPVDLDLGADVDAAGGLVEDQDPRPGGQPLGQDDLLLVAAGEGPDQLVDAGHPHVELLGVLRGDPALGRGSRRGAVGTGAAGSAASRSGRS